MRYYYNDIIIIIIIIIVIIIIRHKSYFCLLGEYISTTCNFLFIVLFIYLFI